MSDAREQNYIPPNGNGAGPTRSFDGSVVGPGGQIGPFRIERELGRGGAGVVYLAHDTKLDRPVAVKSLPDEVMSNPKARTRFAREARVLASLNHPNIGTIYDELQEAEGVGYLILEYVPGQTLAERIAGARLKLQEVLSIAQQITEAVAAAHEHDVIHRDLKPGNIKITPEGKVKVLDFGLAKAVGGEATDQQSTVTEPGRIIGTPAYMSPEQARGQATDKRSDIWSFGCVLYEMLTGKVPFEGETVSDTLASILDHEPRWEALPQSTPANIRILLRRCLEKDPRRRLRDIGDAGIDISESLNLPATAAPVATSLENIARPVGLWRLIAIIAVVVFVAVTASLITWNLKHPAPVKLPVKRFTVRPETDFLSHALYHHALALSPDGKRLAYVEKGSDRRGIICLREMDEFKAKPLPGTETAICPFFSPDGQWIGYVDHFQRKLKKVSVKGGAPMILADSLFFKGGSWGDDDTIIFTPSLSEGLWRISASGEGLERLTILDPNQGEQGHWWPQILPGGKAALFTNTREGGLDEHQIEVLSLETRQHYPLFKGGTYARHVPTGHIVYARKETLYAVRFDVQQLQIVGSPAPVVQDIMTNASSRSAQFTISQDGTLAYIPVQARSAELRPVWVDRQGQIEPLMSAASGGYHTVSISPDGMWAAFSILDGMSADIWIYDLRHHTINPLTSDGRSYFPIWTSDGKQVVFSSLRHDKSLLFVQNVDGSGEPKLLAVFEDTQRWPTSCSSDGNEILLDTVVLKHLKRDMDISVIVLGQEEQPSLRYFIQRNVAQKQAVWSPDGQWVAYSSDESRRQEVYVEPYPEPDRKIQISTEGGYQPTWSHDGKELFYRNGNKMIAAIIETEPEFKVTEFEELFEGPYLYTPLRNYDIGPDGRFLMIQEPQDLTRLGINAVLNWFEELKRLAPTGKN